MMASVILGNQTLLSSNIVSVCCDVEAFFWSQNVTSLPNFIYSFLMPVLCFWMFASTCNGTIVWNIVLILLLDVPCLI